MENASSTSCPLGPEKCQRFGNKIKVISLEEPMCFRWSASASSTKRTGFLDLPRELRDEIYRHIVVADKGLYAGTVCLDTKGASHWHPPWPGQKHLRCLKGNLNLLATCKQIHSEATEMLYGQNEIIVDVDLKSATVLTRQWLEKGLPNLSLMPFNSGYHRHIQNIKFCSLETAGLKGLIFFHLMLVRLRNVQGAFVRFVHPQEQAALGRHQWFSGYWDGKRSREHIEYQAGWQRNVKPMYDSHNGEDIIILDSSSREVHRLIAHLTEKNSYLAHSIPVLEIDDTVTLRVHAKDAAALNSLGGWLLGLNVSSRSDLQNRTESITARLHGSEVFSQSQINTSFPTGRPSCFGCQMKQDDHVNHDRLLEGLKHEGGGWFNSRWKLTKPRKLSQSIQANRCYNKDRPSPVKNGSFLKRILHWMAHVFST